MHRPNSLLSSILVCFIASSSACGGSVETSDGHTGGAGAGASAGTGGTADAGCNPIPCPYPGWNPATCSCFPPSQSGKDASADVPASAMTMSITSIDMWVDCMPEVPPDPLGGTFTVRYDNSKGSVAATATVLAAKWQLPGDWAFTVEPSTSGAIPAGQAIDVVHKKVPGSAKGSDNPCSVCNGVGSLVVTWDVNGASLSDSQTGAPNCAY